MIKFRKKKNHDKLIHEIVESLDYLRENDNPFLWINVGGNMKKLSKEVRFIKGFQEIKSSKICNKYGVDQSNLCKGNTTRKNEILVSHELLKDVILLLVDVYLDPELEVENERKNSL
jgi:hypothetical protein